MRTLVAVSSGVAGLIVSLSQIPNPRSQPHSEQMRLEERSRRVDAATLELLITLTDPVVYTRPWIRDTKRFRLNRDKALGWDEQIYCVPSESSSSGG